MIMYNFTNAIDEVMTQQELEKTPEGKDFIRNWTWANQECYNGHPRFRRSNTIEDYFYVRLVERDMLLGIGAIRIHWNKNGTFMIDNNMQIVLAGQNFHWCQDPCRQYDLFGIIKEKLYRYLNRKLMSDRYCDSDNNGCCDYPVPPCRPNPCPPPPPPCPPSCEPPYFRGYDDRGLDYKNHRYRPKPDEIRHNPPKHGPYGGIYNANDDR